MQTGLTKQYIPWLMAAARAALGPAVILGERCNWSGTTLAVMVVTALISDIYDGVLARRWRCDTAGVRLFDSIADTVFYLCVGAALWFGRSPALRDNSGLLLALLVAEAARYVLDFARFGKPASYHSYLAKMWGLVIAFAVVITLTVGDGGLLIRGSLVLGLLCNAEGFVMTLILPQWTRDVKGIVAAVRLRREWAPAPIGRNEQHPLLT